MASLHAPEPGPASAVLAVDPGSSKCGVAVVDSAGRVLFRGITPTSRVAALAAELAGRHGLRAVVLGGGTGSGPVRRALEAAVAGMPLEVVDEEHTSEAARALWSRLNPPRGWRRLLPAGLRVPDCPYDDLVAVILAQRWWAAAPGDASPAPGAQPDPRNPDSPPPDLLPRY